MDWLMNNPLADMYGPLFLFVYAGAIAATAIACRVMTRRLDWTAKMAPPPVPSDPDPHEIAYLRGGENEVTRSVIFALVQRGLLRTTETGIVERVWEKKETGHLSPIERRAYDYFLVPYKTSDIYKSGALASQLKPFCDVYEQRLQRERLLTTDDVRQTARMVVLAGASVVLGLGAYKLIVAVAEGRYNVIFLMAFGLVGVFVIAAACRLPRVSRRGHAYLERLQLAFQRLKWQAQAAPALAAPNGGEAATVHGLDPSMLLLVGVFGVGALAGTQYDSFEQSFHRAAAANNNANAANGGSGCGSSCGSASSSSDSSSGSWFGGGGDSSGSSSDSGSSCSSGSSCGSSCGGGCGGGCGG